MWACDLDHLRDGLVEELSIMRDDHISSLPRLFEVVLEPLDTGEIDEVCWLIEKEKFGLREESLSECYLGPLSS